MKFNTEIITLKISSSSFLLKMFSPFVGCMTQTLGIEMK
jgi:hypothetical protein